MLQLQRKISHPLKDVSLIHIPKIFFQTVFLRQCLSSSKGWLTAEMTEKQAPCKYFICSPLLSAYAGSLYFHLCRWNPTQYIWVWSSFWILAQHHFTIIEGVAWNAAEGLVLSPPVWDLMGGLGQTKAIVILEQVSTASRSTSLPCSNFSLQLKSTWYRGSKQPWEDQDQFKISNNEKVQVKEMSCEHCITVKS